MQKMDENFELKLLIVYQTTLHSKEYNYTGPVGRQDDLITYLLSPSHYSTIKILSHLSNNDGCKQKIIIKLTAKSLTRKRKT